jgi:hypothetical protein
MKKYKVEVTQTITGYVEVFADYERIYRSIILVYGRNLLGLYTYRHYF